MANDIRRITELTYKAASGTITPEEWEELSAFVHTSPENWNRFEERIEKLRVKERLEILRQWENAKEASEEKVLHALSLRNKPYVRMWKRGLVAASVVIIAGGLTIWKMKSEKVMPPASNVIAVQNDVLPGTNKAILTLANGSTIVLDSAENGTLARQGNMQVVKLDSGMIAYNGYQGSGSGENLYNTITTPKGGQYKLILPDGSKVWLNAASALRYPIAFSGSSRSVELLAGEAYLEVAHRASQPFTLHVPAARPGDQDLAVEVLGTSFDVNAYPDEPATDASLVEGSVKVVKGRRTVLLHPGEQAQAFSGSESITVNSSVNVAGLVAWKDGMFSFDRAGTEAVMRQLARWYDVDISYEGKVPARQFVGTIPRNVPASDVLKLLELNHIHFKIEGKKIIVTP